MSKTTSIKDLLKKTITKFSADMASDEKAGWLVALEQIMVMETAIARLGAITTKNQDNGTILKKSRITGEPVPAHLQTVYVFSWSSVGIGHDYEDLVNNLLIAAGLEPNFNSSSSYDQRYLESKIVYQHKKYLDRFYFRVYPEACENWNPVYKYFNANMEEISSDDYKKIKAEYFKKSSKSAVEVRNYGMDSIYVVNFGEHFDKIQDSDFLQLLELFKSKN